MVFKNGFGILILTISTGFFCCNISSDSEEGKDVEWTVKKSTLKPDADFAISINKIEVDQFTYSYDGNWICGDTSIFVYDNLFRTISEINPAGAVLKQFGGIDTLHEKNKWWLPYTLSKHASGYTSVFLRAIAYLDDSFTVKRIKEIKYDGKVSVLSMLEEPDPFNMNAYELNERNSNYLRISEDEFLVSLESEAPAFNPYNSLEYFKKALSFGLVNVKNATFVGVPIRKSKIYQKECCLSVQDASYVIKKGDEFHVQFAADTLVYVYGSNFQPLFAYGLKGVFKQNFIQNNGLDIAFEDEKYQSLQSKANTIDGLFLFDEKYIGRLVNNRTVGKKYIQFFLNSDLVAEVEVPATFRYIGSIRNRIIGITAEDEKNEKIEICIIN